MPEEYHSPDHEPLSGKSIAALILGILSVIFSLSVFLGVILGIIGIALALTSRKKSSMHLNAKIGLGLSIAGILCSVLILTFIYIPVVHSSSSDDIINRIEKELEDPDDSDSYHDRDDYDSDHDWSFPDVPDDNTPPSGNVGNSYSRQFQDL